MRKPQRILLLDDDKEFLETYRELLAQMPSRPEVQVANSGTRAIQMLEAQSFTLLISDLRMSKMDGFQVLAVVRRQYPELRTVVITALADEQYRARAYALGVDLFLQKPSSAEESRLFFDCVESVLNSEIAGGFRGVHSKSLVDIIQLECLSQSSSVLKIIQGNQEGRVWFQNGEIIDAQAGELRGEAAFRRIFSWKNGNFEVLPAEPGRERTIFDSYQGLLLESAQALDEAADPQHSAAGARENPLREWASLPGVEFVLTAGEGKPVRAWGVENADSLSVWLQNLTTQFRQLGEKLLWGELRQIDAATAQQKILIWSRSGKLLCAGLQNTLPTEQSAQTAKQLHTRWES